MYSVYERQAVCKNVVVVARVSRCASETLRAFNERASGAAADLILACGLYLLPLLALHSGPCLVVQVYRSSNGYLKVYLEFTRDDPFSVGRVRKVRMRFVCEPCPDEWERLVKWVHHGVIDNPKLGEMLPFV